MLVAASTILVSRYQLLSLRELPATSLTRASADFVSLSFLLCSSSFALPPLLSLRLSSHLTSQSIASAYKIYVYERTPTPSITAVSGKVAFYFLSALPELLVTALYLSVNLNSVFDIEEGKMRDKIEKAMKKGTYTGGEGWEKQQQQQGFGGQHEMNRV